jgi:hypothetical protein
MSATFNYIARQREENMRAVENRLATGDFMGAPSYAAPKAKRGPRGVRGRGANVRKMFMEVGGIGSYNVEMVIPQAFFMPRTTDPDAQATILTVEGVQRAINKVGGHVEVNGILTPDTVQNLRRVSGASWMSKTWLQIYGDFGEMMSRGMTLKTKHGHAPALGDYVEVGDIFTTIPMVTLGAGALLLFFAFKK